MPTPSVAVFDLGKVLVDFDYAIAARRIAARGKITLAQIGEFIAQSPLFNQYESGAVTTQQFFEEICRISGFRGQPGGVRQVLRGHLCRD